MSVKTRTIPPCPDLPPVKPTERTYHVRVVTPLFGGGAKAGQVDPQMPIRGTSIRGQLRFWWRATRGASSSTVQALREREFEVWGSPKAPSPVWVAVKNSKFPPPKPCARWNPRPGKSPQLLWNDDFARSFDGRPSPLPYVAFPFQGTSQPRSDRDKPANYLPAGGGFDLQLVCPAELTTEVESALWAWINFGGLGARTRRGCGSLYCDKFSPPAAGIEAWYKARVKQYALDLRSTRDWPTLGERVFVRDKAESTLSAWQYLVDEYRSMRQGEIGRKPGSGTTPGRSYWPEPETIRKATKQRLAKHARLIGVPDDAVPRAALGLPIVTPFHPQEKGPTKDDDPRDTIWVPLIKGVPGDRWASALILKPLAVSTGQAVPLVVAMNGPRVTDVALIDPKAGMSVIKKFGPASIRNPTFALPSYPNSPLSGVATGDALEAVIEQLTGTSYGCRRKLSG